MNVIGKTVRCYDGRVGVVDSQSASVFKIIIAHPPWPFPDWVVLNRKQFKLLSKASNMDDIELAPF